MAKSCGAARWAYNWGLQRKNEVYAMNQLPVPRIKTPTAIDLHKELVRLKRTKVPWMYEVSKCAPQEALRNLDEAFQRFFKGLAGYPRFKSKKNGLGSFRLTGSIIVSEKHIQLPHIGKVRLKERNYIPTGRRARSVTVSEKAGRWFVSVGFDEEREVVPNCGPVVGVDLGIDKLARVSDGTLFENPRALQSVLKRVKRLQQEVSRKKKGSKNRKKAVRRLARALARTANIRKDALHKMTTQLARTNSVIVIEGLSVENMVKNHSLARAILDAGWREGRQQLTYKTDWYGSELVVADRWYPSSKVCSGCGAVKADLLLSERVYVCEVCHLAIDRDLNASINLSRLAASSTESINACPRQEVAGLAMPVQCLSMKQESDIGLSNDRFV